MPIGNVSKDPAPRRDSFRPPWVKEKDAEAPPSWVQRKLKPVDSAKSTAESEVPASAPIAKPLKRKYPLTVVTQKINIVMKMKLSQNFLQKYVCIKLIPNIIYRQLHGQGVWA